MAGFMSVPVGGKLGPGTRFTVFGRSSSPGVGGKSLPEMVLGARGMGRGDRAVLTALRGVKCGIPALQRLYKHFLLC